LNRIGRCDQGFDCISASESELIYDAEIALVNGLDDCLNEENELHDTVETVLPRVMQTMMHLMLFSMI
jgi:hypothetical protein